MWIALNGEARFQALASFGDRVVVSATSIGARASAKDFNSRYHRNKTTSITSTHIIAASCSRPPRWRNKHWVPSTSGPSRPLRPSRWHRLPSTMSRAVLAQSSSTDYEESRIRLSTKAHTSSSRGCRNPSHSMYGHDRATSAQRLVARICRWLA